MNAKEREVVCPSGMRGVIRPLKVTEERLYKNAQAIKNNRIIPQFISHGWSTLLDPGIYTFEDGKVDWDKVLLGDAMYLLMQVRAATYTTDYPVVFPCQSCNKPIEHTINVLTDMRIQHLPDETLSSIKAGVPLEVDFKGQTVSFRLLCLGDEQRITRIEDMRKLSRDQAALAVRIVDVEGIDKSGFGIINWIEGMDASEPDELIELLDEYDCGVDTDISVICESCMYQQEFALPLERSFFRRPAKKQKERKKERAQAHLAKEL